VSGGCREGVARGLTSIVALPLLIDRGMQQISEDDYTGDTELYVWVERW
jgi:hypothetical protein